LDVAEDDNVVSVVPDLPTKEDGGMEQHRREEILGAYCQVWAFVALV